MSELRICVVGCAGRMGRTLVREVLEAPDCALSGGTEQPGHEAIGRDLGEVTGFGRLNLPITDDPLPLFADSDAVLDFTTPKATLLHAELAAQARLVHVIGTTGLAAEDMEALKAAARHATIVQAENMSLGVNLLAQLTRRIAAALGEDFDVEILEMHHRHKADAPSGTALMLGRAAAEGRGVALDEVAERGRDGWTGPRQSGRIGFAVLRGGSVVGEHTVLFAGPDEVVEIGHRASDRAIFARGAIRAARWGRGKGPGLFSMAHVLGFAD